MGRYAAAVESQAAQLAGAPAGIEEAVCTTTPWTQTWW